MTKIVREPRLVIRISGPLLAVLEAAGVAEGRTAAGQARKVTRKQSRHCLFDISALTGNPVAYRSCIRLRKKPFGLVNLDAKLAVSTVGQRRGGRLLVMLWVAHKGSLRGAAFAI